VPNLCRTAAIFLLFANAAAAMYIVDGGVYRPPDITTVDPNNPNPDNYSIRYFDPEFLPNLHFWYRDPVFNPNGSNFPERIMRLTDAAGIGAVTVMHEYSSLTPFNESRTKMTVFINGSIAVYDLKTYEYRLIGELSHALPRWSRTDENILYYWPYVNGGSVKLFQYDASTGTSSAVGDTWNFNGHAYDHTFNNAGEDDLCFGGGHIVRLVGWQGRQYMVVFSLEAKAVVAEYDLTGYSVNSVEIAPSLDVLGRTNDKRDILIVGFNINEEKAPSPFGEMGKGIWAFKLDENAAPENRIKPYQQVNTSLAHHDLGLDVDGGPIVVATNAATINPVAGCQNNGHGIEKIPLSNPDSTNRSTSTCLLTGIPWSLSEHISLPDQTGWVFVSLEDPSDPMPGQSGWQALTNEIVQLRLDGSKQLRRLAHHRSRPSPDGYKWQARVSVSRDGSLLGFTSNFGFGSLQTDYADVYLINNVRGPDGPENTLSATKQGAGSGAIVSRPSGVYCGQTCSAAFNSDARVTLTAVPSAGSSFAGWRGACFGGGLCTVQMNRAKNVTAVFDLK